VHDDRRVRRGRPFGLGAEIPRRHGEGGGAVRARRFRAAPGDPAAGFVVPHLELPAREGVAGARRRGQRDALPGAVRCLRHGLDFRIRGIDCEGVPAADVIGLERDARAATLAVALRDVAGVGVVVGEAARGVARVVQRDRAEGEAGQGAARHDEQAVLVIIGHRDGIRFADGARAVGEADRLAAAPRLKPRRVGEERPVGPLVVAVRRIGYGGSLVAAVKDGVSGDFERRRLRRIGRVGVPDDVVALLDGEQSRVGAGGGNGLALRVAVSVRMGVAVHRIGHAVNIVIVKGEGVDSVCVHDGRVAVVINVRALVSVVVVCGRGAGAVGGLVCSEVCLRRAVAELCGVEPVGEEIVARAVAAEELILGVDDIDIPRRRRIQIICSAVHRHFAEAVPQAPRIGIGSLIGLKRGISRDVRRRRGGRPCAVEHVGFVGDADTAGLAVDGLGERMVRLVSGLRQILGIVDHIQRIARRPVGLDVIDGDVAAVVLAEDIAVARARAERGRRGELVRLPVVAVVPVIGDVVREIAARPEVGARLPARAGRAVDAAVVPRRGNLAVEQRQRLAGVACSPPACLFDGREGRVRVVGAVVIVIGNGHGVRLAVEIGLQGRGAVLRDDALQDVARVVRAEIVIGKVPDAAGELRIVDRIRVRAADRDGRAGVAVVVQRGLQGILPRRRGLAVDLHLVRRFDRPDIVPRDGHVAGGHGGRRRAGAPVLVGGQDGAGRGGGPVCPVVGRESAGIDILPVIPPLGMGVEDGRPQAAAVDVQRQRVAVARVVDVDVRAGRDGA